MAPMCDQGTRRQLARAWSEIALEPERRNRVTYPLAHDDEGMPLKVPPMATGWLVRRHAGGKGRPGAVYDREGRPLVVSLDATGADLRQLGCKSGSFRLDAVDASGKALGVTAYTELSADADETSDAEPENGEPAVLALARAVEAMQRVQAERERMQAAIFEKLIDRIAPPPIRPAEDLRNAVTQVLDIQKEMRRALSGDAEEVDDVDEAADDEIDVDGPPWMAELLPLLQSMLPLLNQWFASRPAPAPRNATTISAAEGSDSRDPSAATVSVADGEAQAARSSVAAGTDEDARASRLAAILQQLAPDERAKAEMLMARMPKEAVATVIEQILSMPSGEAVQQVRKGLATMSVPMAAPAGASKNGPRGPHGGTAP